MSLIFTKREDDKIEELQIAMDEAIERGAFSLAESFKLEIQDITEAAIIRAQNCIRGFMTKRAGKLPAALTVQAI